MCRLLHDTDPSPSSPRLVVSLYDDYESSLPPKPDFIAHTPLTSVKEVIDPPFIAPSLSSTPRDTIKGVLSTFFSPYFSSMHGVRDG